MFKSTNLEVNNLQTTGKIMKWSSDSHEQLSQQYVPCQSPL